MRKEIKNLALIALVASTPSLAHEYEIHTSESVKGQVVSEVTLPGMEQPVDHSKEVTWLPGLPEPSVAPSPDVLAEFNEETYSTNLHELLDDYQLSEHPTEYLIAMHDSLMKLSEARREIKDKYLESDMHLMNDAVDRVSRSLAEHGVDIYAHYKANHPEYIDTFARHKLGIESTQYLEMPSGYKDVLSGNNVTVGDVMLSGCLCTKGGEKDVTLMLSNGNIYGQTAYNIYDIYGHQASETFSKLIASYGKHYKSASMALVDQHRPNYNVVNISTGQLRELVLEFSEHTEYSDAFPSFATSHELAHSHDRFHVHQNFLQWKADIEDGETRDWQQRIKNKVGAEAFADVLAGGEMTLFMVNKLGRSQAFAEGFITEMQEFRLRQREKKLSDIESKVTLGNLSELLKKEPLIAPTTAERSIREYTDEEILSFAKYAHKDVHQTELSLEKLKTLMKNESEAYFSMSALELANVGHVIVSASLDTPLAHDFLADENIASIINVEDKSVTAKQLHDYGDFKF